MKRKFVLAAMVTLTAFLALAQAVEKKTHSQTKAEQTVREREADYGTAVKRQDVSALDKILADDFASISSRGEVRNKAQETADVKASPDYDMEDFTLDDVNVRVFGGTAIVTGRETLKVRVKGQSSTSVFRYTRIYVKRKPNWQAVAQQVVRMPAASQQPATAAMQSVQEGNERLVKQISGQIAGRENEPATQVFKNIQWLKTVPAGLLLRIMYGGYSRALGVSCTHCHVEEDFSSDEKRPKRAAREMAVMHRMINQQLRNMENLKSKPEERAIACGVCHRGSTDPLASFR